MGKYIRNLATSFIGQLGVKADDYDRCPAQDIYKCHSEAITTELRRMRPETLGRIAASKPTKTTLYQVHCGSYLSKHSNGKDLLLTIACTAIVAEMADIISSR